MPTGFVALLDDISVIAKVAAASIDDIGAAASKAGVKAAGVVVYTIGFSTPNDPIDNEGLQLLSKCASGANRFYVAKDSSSLSNAFADIGTSLSRLRLVR